MQVEAEWLLFECCWAENCEQARHSRPTQQAQLLHLHEPKQEILEGPPGDPNHDVVHAQSA